MNRITLKRFLYSPDMGTLGRIYVGDWWCWTLEEIWNQNRRGISCIPVGTYRLLPATHHISTPDPNDDYPVYEVADVPGRSAIHIHVGNTIADIEGCILVGLNHGVVKEKWAVTRSRQAFTEFMERVGAMGTNDLWLAIGNMAPVEGVL